MLAVRTFCFHALMWAVAFFGAGSLMVLSALSLLGLI